MKRMKTYQEVFDILDSLKLPYYRQGSAPEELPESFYTFWQIDSDGMMPFDNLDRGSMDVYQIVYYTTDVSTLYTGAENATRAFMDAGWDIDIFPIDIDTDNPYHGRMIRIEKINYRQEVL